METKREIIQTVIKVTNDSKNVCIKIYKRDNIFVPTCQISGVKVECGEYTDKMSAAKAANFSMKLALENKLIYRDCWYCGKRSYHPQSFCSCGNQFVCTEWSIEHIKVKNINIRSLKDIATSKPIKIRKMKI